MSRSTTTEQLGGEEWTAVQRSLRISVISLAATAVLITTFLAVTPADPFPTGQLRITLATLVLLIPIFIWRRSDVAAYLSVLALYAIAVSAWFSTPLSDARLSASTTLFLVALCGIVYLRGAWQWAWIALIGASWCAIVPQVPLPATVLGSTLNLRWGALVQLLLACACVTVAWRNEMEHLRVRDAVAREVEAAALAATIARERLRIWRASLVRVHETVLNDIRSVLDADHIDGPRLRRQLQLADASAPPPWGHTTLHHLVSTISIAQGPGQRVVLGQLARVNLDPERAAALRTLLLELLRNAFRHGRATEVRMSATADDVGLRILLQHDGRQERGSNDAPGMGVAVVLQGAADALQAVAEHADGSITIAVPMASTEQAVAPTTRPDVGRVIISAGTAGYTLGGVIQAMALGLSGGITAAAVGLLATAIACTAASVVWRRRVSITVLLIGAIASTLLPLLTRSLIAGCSDVALPVSVAMLSSMGYATMLVWAPSTRWWWLALGNAVTMVWLAPRALDTCPRSVVPSLIAALVAPSMLALNYVALRLSARREARLAELRRREATEQAATEAARDLSNQLHTTIERVRTLLLAVADQQRVTPQVRQELRCLDADLRATLQVEPGTAGSFARLLRDCVHMASLARVPLHVRAIQDSGDQRPLPAEVTAAVRDLLLASTDGDASVMLLPTAEEDTLVITTTPAACQRAGLAGGWQHSFDDGMASLEVDGSEEPAMLMLRRTRSGASAKHGIGQRPETSDTHGDVFAVAQGADAGRRSGEDDIAGQ